jgi:hypothetical protein
MGTEEFPPARLHAIVRRCPLLGVVQRLNRPPPVDAPCTNCLGTTYSMRPIKRLRGQLPVLADARGQTWSPSGGSGTRPADPVGESTVSTSYANGNAVIRTPTRGGCRDHGG